MVPALAIVTLVIWERRWRELLRWELYLGLVLQAAMILTWVWFVYAGPDGPAHLKVFFWNNLVGRFTHVDAPQELQYAAAHRNSPGKYLLELPMYLWPWTLLVVAAAAPRVAAAQAARSTTIARCASPSPPRCRRWPFCRWRRPPATSISPRRCPASRCCSLGGRGKSRRAADRWDLRALRATAALLLLGDGGIRRGVGA